MERMEQKNPINPFHPLTQRSPSSKFNQRISSAVSSNSNAWNEVRVSVRVRGPISGNVGKGWHRTYASATLIGRTPRFRANSLAHSKRRKLSGLYQERTISS